MEVTNRFQGIGSDKVTEELWMKDCNIVQEVVIRTIPKKKEWQKWLSEEVLQIAEKRREFIKLKLLIAQSCPTHCNPIDCSLPGFSVHGIFLARILEFVAIPFLTQGWNPGLPHCRQILYHLSPQGSPNEQ